MIHCDMVVTPQGDKFHHKCKACGYSIVSRGDKFFRTCPKPVTCVHRSAEPLRKVKVECDTCGGKRKKLVSLPIYGCALFRECSLVRVVEMLPCCKECDQFKAE